MKVYQPESSYNAIILHERVKDNENDDDRLIATKLEA